MIRYQYAYVLQMRSKGQRGNWHSTFASWVPDLAQVFSPALVCKQGSTLKSPGILDYIADIHSHNI